MRKGTLLRVLPLVFALLLGASAAELSVVPLPAVARSAPGALSLSRGLRITLAGAPETLRDYILRRGGLTSRADSASLEIRAASRQGDDESYELSVTPQRAILSSNTVLGALRGVETFLQLIDGGRVPACHVRDKPRFPWRGLTLDVARHYLPLDAILRQIDAMAVVKLNVLHLHLTDDQAFRLETRCCPALHEKGSGGQFYTQEELRRIISHAAERGIRVIPEFDLPGHSTSWLAGYPELAARPGSYSPEKRFGVFHAYLDLKSERVLSFLDRLFAEVAALFPDSYIHVGGDETEAPAEWVARLHPLLARHGKKMIVWDESLSPALPKDTLVQAWRGRRPIITSTFAGYSTLISDGFYLDHNLSAEHAYLTRMDGTSGNPEDFLDRFFARQVSPPAGAKVRPELIRGGEACLFGEFTTPANVDIRLWPRAAAVAERLWSPASARDIDSLYRRLARLDAMLGIAAVYEQRLKELAGAQPVEPLRTLADVLEPAKYVYRVVAGKYDTSSPLDTLIDVLRPESLTARNFRAVVAAGRKTEIRRRLVVWRDNHARVLPVLQSNPRLQAMIPVSEELARVASLGLDALDGKKIDPAPLNQAANPRREASIAIAPAVRSLAKSNSGTANRRSEVEQRGSPQTRTGN